MRSVALGLAYVALLAFAGCGKDIAQAPNFTGANDEDGSGAASSTGDATTEGGADTEKDPDPDPDDDAPADTMPPSDSSSDGGSDSTTMPVDPGSDDGVAGGCNDGMVSAGEQCDGDDLQGFDCTSLGLAGGTLACDPVTCTFDTSMCMSDSGGGTGGM